MKRKSWVIFSLVVIALFCFFLFAPLTVGIKKQIIISASMIDVARQLTDLKNWHRWNAELKDKDSSLIQISDQSNQVNSWLRVNDLQYVVVRHNPADITLRESSGGIKTYYSIFVLPDSSGARSNVVWIEELSPLAWIKEKINSSGNAERSLNNLKNYFEDSKQYYGFDIHMGSVLDSLVITEIAACPNKDRINVLASLYKNIVAYANKNNLGITETTPRMANFYEFNKDSVTVMAGIPVSKKAAPENNLSYLEMPSHGKMLFGYYEGDYVGFKNLRDAVHRYIADKNLKTIAVPYERYLTNPKTSQDSLHMKIVLCYPIL